MKALSTFVLLLCVFVAGVFLGIWMDWSAHNKRNLNYVLEDYNMANLQVHPGDSLSLVSGGQATDPKMTFVGGYDPCLPGGKPNTCVIDKNASAGPYIFNCSSANGYACTDPGIQQSPTGPGPFENFSYGGFVKTDFMHLFGMQRSSTQKHEPVKAPAAPAASSSVSAYVSCLNGQTALNGPDGGSLTTIKASVGEAVYWISPKPFTLDTSSFPPGLCSNGNPGGSGLTQASCVVALGVPGTSYQVQAQTTPTCAALKATLQTK